MTVHNLLSKEEIQSFRDEVKGTLKTTDAGPKSSYKSYSTFWGDNTIRFSQLASRSKTFLNKYLVHPLVIQMADAELVPNEYWLNTGEMMCIGPNSKPQELHRDADSWPKMCESRESDPVEIAFMLSVDDFTEETGATCVVPGSQNWDDYSRTPKSCEVVQAAMPVGSVLIYSGKVVIVEAQTALKIDGEKVVTFLLSQDGLFLKKQGVYRFRKKKLST